VGASALTIAVKGADGNAPSATNPVWVPFRSSTATSGAINWRSVTAALTTTISSGSTGGHISAVKQYLFWYAIDNNGTVELAWSSKFFGNHGIVTTTAEGGAGAADSAIVMYSATARVSVPFACIALSEDTQAVAGTWATAPSQINLAPFTIPGSIAYTPVATLVGGAGNTVPVYLTTYGNYTSDGRTCRVVIQLKGDGGAEGAGTGQLTLTLPIPISSKEPAAGHIRPVGRILNNALNAALYAAVVASATSITLQYQNAATTLADVVGDTQNNTARQIDIILIYEHD
jgi:hypothetical protein